MLAPEWEIENAVALAKAGDDAAKRKKIVRKKAPTGVVNWGEEDLDEDGNPGLRVYIDAPVCSGNLHVTNKTTTNARGFGDDKGTPIHGEVTISNRQKILDADGKCLSAMAKDSYERSKGSFRYVRIKAGDTCSSLLGAAWPVKAK